MSIMIKTIVKAVNTNKLAVKASHYNEILDVYIQQSQDKVEKIINENINFEMEYEEVLNHAILHDYNDLQSGLFMASNNSIKVRGRVHNLIKLEEDTIVDIYIQQGAEFISVLSSELSNIVPNIADGIEIVVKGLTIYPIYY